MRAQVAKKTHLCYLFVRLIDLLRFTCKFEFQLVFSLFGKRLLSILPCLKHFHTIMKDVFNNRYQINVVFHQFGQIIEIGIHLLSIQLL